MPDITQLTESCFNRFESILFSILIGVGVDFVLHFAHAYTSHRGIVSKEKRTLHALLRMGPSVLGSAFTTLSTALIMVSMVYCLFITKAKTVQSNFDLGFLRS